MALVTLKELLKHAKENKYAVGGFNINGLDDAQGMVTGAMQARSPIILMVGKGALDFIGLHQVVGMVRGMSIEADVPVCLHLDHATDVGLIKRAIVAGFSSVMIDASDKDYESNISTSLEIVKFAKDYPCSVEAELGVLMGKEDQISSGATVYTDPNDVPGFVGETGIDALAIAFGSAHGFYTSEPKLNFDILSRVAEKTDCPLVLHGGTGIPQSDIKKCIELGIRKINVGTEFKEIFSHALREGVQQYPQDMIEPRKYLSLVRSACCENVKNKFDLFGSTNMAG